MDAKNEIIFKSNSPKKSVKNENEYAKNEIIGQRYRNAESIAQISITLTMGEANNEVRTTKGETLWNATVVIGIIQSDAEIETEIRFITGLINLRILLDFNFRTK